MQKVALNLWGMPQETTMSSSQSKLDTLKNNICILLHLKLESLKDNVCFLLHLSVRDSLGKKISLTIDKLSMLTIDKLSPTLEI